LAPIDAPDQRVEVGLLGTSRKATRAWRNNQSPAVVANTRKLVLDAVEPCLRNDGAARLSLESIAEAVGVTTDSLRSAFGTLTDIVEQAIKQSLPALDREITFDLSTPDLTTAEVLTRHLTRLTAWSTQHPELANALRSPLGGVPIDPSAQDPDTSKSAIFQTLSALAQRVVQDGVDRFELAHTTEPERVAPVVTYLALTPSQTPAPHTPRESARWVTSLVIDGLKNNPDARQDPRASND
jgi:AcrR family transcriptional regulator